MKCNFDIRVNSYVLVMLPGGTTMFPEIGDRMTKKTTELPLPTTKIKVVSPPERDSTPCAHFSRCGFRRRVRWIWPDRRQ